MSSTAPGAVQFYNPATANDEDTAVNESESLTAPLAAAGTFGVTKSVGDGRRHAVTRSYVGAFGADLMQ